MFGIEGTATSATNVQQGFLNIILTVNGAASTVGIASIIVRHELNQISYAEIVLIGDDKNTSTLTTVDDTTFDPGGVIIIKASYDDAAPVQIFSGLIVQHGVELPKSGPLKIHLLCKHKLVTATYNRVDKEFHALSDSAIISSVLTPYGGGTVSSTVLKYEVLFQKMLSDWDFICARAEFNGFIIALDGVSPKVGMPSFLLPGATMVPKATITLSGGNMYSFFGKLSAENQPTTVSASSWDIKTKAAILSAATEPSALSKLGDSAYSASSLSKKLSQKSLILNSSAAMSSDDLKTWANGVLLRKRLAAFKGKVSCIGDIGSKITTDSIINISGVGKKLDGNAYVTGVTHEIKEGKWETTLKFGLEERYAHEKINFNDSLATGQAAAFHGLQIGTVKQLSKDPQSFYRILVLINTTSTVKTGFWARVSNFYATNNAGLGFLPEIGDEVVVGFLDDDTRHPIVLGSLYGKNIPANGAKDENNYIKQILTKALLKINFDDQNKILTFSTPGNNSIVLDDKNKNITVTDINKNSITLTASGITINSAKDINLTAKGGINLTASKDIIMKAKDCTATASGGITLKATKDMIAEGTSSAQLTSSKEVVIKGGIVNIN